MRGRCPLCVRPSLLLLLLLLPHAAPLASLGRYTDAFVRSEYTVASLGGPAGSGFVFDTNTIHKGVPEGMLARTTIVLEYHAKHKCPVIQHLELPVPCPSGDQRLVPQWERDGATNVTAGATS